jgi:hypothetical protein
LALMLTSCSLLKDDRFDIGGAAKRAQLIISWDGNARVAGRKNVDDKIDLNVALREGFIWQRI